MVVLEQRLTGIRNALVEARYPASDLGYMPAGVLNGNPKTEKQAERFVRLRYVMIPWNLIENSIAPPYVILDSSIDGVDAAIPAGFAKLYDSGDGLALLQRTPVK